MQCHVIYTRFTVFQNLLTVKRKRNNKTVDADDLHTCFQVCLHQVADLCCSAKYHWCLMTYSLQSHYCLEILHLASSSIKLLPLRLDAGSQSYAEDDQKLHSIPHSFNKKILSSPTMAAADVSLVCSSEGQEAEVAVASAAAGPLVGLRLHWITSSTSLLLLGDWL